MRFFIVCMIFLSCSNAVAENIQFTEDQWIDLLVQIKCIEKTHEGISQEALILKASEKAKELNIKNFSWKHYLQAHKYYTTRPNFLEKNMLPIGIRIGECVKPIVESQVASKGFYGAPIYKDSQIVNKVDFSSLSVATLQLMSKDDAILVYEYYKKAVMPFNPSESKVNGAAHIQYTQQDKNRAVMVDDTPFGTEITIMIEK
ncbi:hypothetical protein [Desulfoluna sp.]|uniref:hypothetical protein n=1 Tax=Desulfoluna sp. TaxID=2045199 RepID=UPI0026051FD0|nr:hypothetical protein [Desulfoluna sp.]